jgi:flagellar capping protein FliD
MQTILNQNTQPDLVTQDATTLTQLNNIALTTKKIQELQTTLKIEQQHLNKNINELNQTIKKQEQIIKTYYDTLRNKIKKAQQIITQDNPTITEPKTEADKNKS